MKVEDLVGAAYDAVLEPALWPRVLKESNRLLASEMASLRVFDADGEELIMIGHGDCLTPELNAEYRANWMERDLHTLKARANPSLWNRPIVSEFEIVPEEEERRSAYIQEFLLTAGICRMVASVAAGAHGMATAAFFKAPDAPLAGERELAAGAALLPHLTRAVRMASSSAWSPLVLASLFEGAAHAVLMLDDRGRIVWSNGRAEELLRAGGLCVCASGAMRCEGAAGRMIDALAREARMAGGKGRAPRLALHQIGGKPHVMRGRVIGRQTWPCLIFRKAAVLIECRPLEASASTGDRLQQAFGLTPAEAAVALALAEDMTVAEIALLRGVSEETVKTQSRAILRKAGVSRRAALTRIVAKLSD